MTRPHFAGIIDFLPTILVSTNAAVRFEVQQLVPGLERMLLGGRAPGGAGVVDENVHLAEFLQDLVGDGCDGLALSHVAHEGGSNNALLLQLLRCLFKLFFFGGQ